MKSVSFTGHRRIAVTGDLKERLYLTLEALIKLGAGNFYAGGAVGWDTLCAETVLLLKEEYPQIKLRLVLPCPPQQQTAKFSEYQREAYQKILEMADEAEICSPEYFRGCMKKRNARLAELADAVVCYCSNPVSGTGQTLSMAQKRGVQIINLRSELIVAEPFTKNLQ